MVMTAGTASRRATLKSTDANVGQEGVQDADQMDYTVFTPDVHIDDKMNINYFDQDGRSMNKTIQAKLVKFDEDMRRHHADQKTFKSSNYN